MFAGLPLDDVGPDVLTTIVVQLLQHCQLILIAKHLGVFAFSFLLLLLLLAEHMYFEFEGRLLLVNHLDKEVGIVAVVLAVV